MSIIVPVPVAVALEVDPLVTVPVNITVSFDSAIKSCIVGTETVVLPVVAPAGIVTVVVVVV